MSPTKPNPYTIDVEEINLDARSLVRVLSQVRFPSLSAMLGERGSSITSQVADRLQSEYPIFESIHENAFMLTPEGLKDVSQADGRPNTWRLRSSDEAWQVTITKEFIALDTSSYDSRADFIDRFSQVLKIFQDIVAPPSAQRIGIRYTNLVTDTEFISNLSQFVTPDLLGTFPTKTPDGVRAEFSLSQSGFVESSGGLNVNVGVLAPKQVLDISLPVQDQRSWILDIDSYSTARTAFALEEISAVLRERAGLAYSTFRWAVTEDFLALYGR